MADERKQELIRELAQARQRATNARHGLSDSLHVGEKINANLSRFRGIWLTGAVLLGLVISKVPPRTKKVVVHTGSKGEQQIKKVGQTGILLAALKMLFDLGKPFLMTWLTKRLRAGRY